MTSVSLPDGQLNNLFTAFLGSSSPTLFTILQVFKEYLGIDVSGIYLLVALAGFVRYGSTCYYWIKSWLRYLFIRTVRIEDSERLFNDVLKWVQSSACLSKRADLTCSAQPAGKDDMEAAVEEKESEWISFKGWDASKKIVYELVPGSYWFFRNRRPFVAQRIVTSTGEGSEDGHRQECIEISTFGMSTVPIEEFVEFCAKTSWNSSPSVTHIYRPCVSTGHACWMFLTSRDNRPIDTVILSKDVKQKILLDINEFLLPSTQTWYAERGIAHRRGYLIYGPPGTGKTSFSFSVAGLFGLEIYCVSLVQNGMDDKNLETLFGLLPQRCIVLLEDLDAEGLQREKNIPSKAEKGSGDKAGDGDDKIDDDNKSRVTLSGLLNVIDGVASREGRILILSTNHPEKLDAALVRPGRIDVKIEFQLSNRPELIEMFKRMYAPSKRFNTGKRAIQARFPAFVESELDEMSLKFADSLPEGKLSPAQVQGFLLQRKRDPQRAVEETYELVKELEKSLVQGQAGDQEDQLNKDDKLTNGDPLMNGDRLVDGDQLTKGTELSKDNELSKDGELSKHGQLTNGDPVISSDQLANGNQVVNGDQLMNGNHLSKDVELEKGSELSKVGQLNGKVVAA